MFTEAQLKRIKEIRLGVYAKDGLNLSINNDIRLLLARIDDLDGDNCSCAGEIIEWTRDRLAEDLRSKKAWLEDALENVRIAELMVREAESALAVVQALKDGGMYEAGEEINARWDAMRALYDSQGMLPVPEPAQIEAPEPVDPPAPEPEPEKPPEDFSDLPPALVDQLAEDHPAKAAKPPAFAPQPVSPPPPTIPPGEQEDRLYAALKALAAGAPEIQARLAVLAEEAGIPKGSCHAVLHRLQAAGRITIIKGPSDGKTKVPQPNIYRFAPAEEAPEPPRELEPPTPEEPSWPDEAVATMSAPTRDLTINRIAPAKPSGAVPQSGSLRERILGVLEKSACTTSGLASMLDVKELAVCQALEAMKHEGLVQTDEMPEGGRRAQLWRTAA